MRKEIDLMIEPTNRCNLKCITCYSHLDKRIKRDMTLGEFKYIIKRNIKLIGNLSLYNYGEPLLNRAIWNMVAYSKAEGIKYLKIATNGMFLDKENIESALSSGLDYLSISLDGVSRESYNKFRVNGDFSHVISNLKKLCKTRMTTKSNLKIEIQFIIMKHNESELTAILDLARKLGVDFLRLKTVLIRDRQWAYLLPRNTELSRYDGRNHNNTCTKPLKELVICCDGSVLPCCYIVGDEINKFSIGNIFTQDLESIINSKKYVDFLHDVTRDKTTLSPCTVCNENHNRLDYKLIKLND